VAKRKKRKPGKAGGERHRAVEASKALGIIEPVEPASRRSDGSPKAGPGQVYATPSGMVYHPAWCRIVANQWDNQPLRLKVIRETGVGQRRVCKSCDEPLTD
jgi:hypothetical protein